MPTDTETEHTLTASLNGRTYTAEYRGLQERYIGDRLAYHCWWVFCDGQRIGTIHDNGYRPRFCGNLQPLRWRYAFRTRDLDPLGHDTGPVGTPVETFAELVKRADRYTEAAIAAGF